MNELRLWSARAALTANLAKVSVLAAIERALGDDRVRICDVGAVGTDPFNLWRPPLELYPDRLQLHGLDLRGVEAARRLAAERGWEVDLRRGDARRIDLAFPGTTFDFVVSTEVIMYIPRWQEALASARRALLPGGRLLLTAAAAEQRLPSSTRVRRLLHRRVSRWRPGSWYRRFGGDTLETAARKADFRLRDRGRYNFDNLKGAVGSLPPADRNGAIRDWYALERRLNASGYAQRRPAAFATLYLDLEAV